MDNMKSNVSNNSKKNIFCNRIVDEPNIFYQQIKNLKSSDLPVVLYGAGSLADYIWRILESNDIKVDAVFTDSPTASDMTFNGLAVQGLPDICSKYGKFNVVLGFHNFEDAEKRMLNVLNVEKIYKISRFSFVDDSVATKSFYESNADRLDAVYLQLNDDFSRDSMVAFVNSMITGKTEYLYSIYAPDTYWPSDLFTVQSEESIVDCGAFTGDTLEYFIKRGDIPIKNYFALEPDPSNFAKLEAYIKDAGISFVTSALKGASSTSGTISFSMGNGDCSHVSDDGQYQIDVDTIDSIVKGLPVTLIKMDIEGAELDALHGAKETILANRPRLAICVYHKPEDLFDIPEYILSLVPSYKIYIREHCKVPSNLVLYAI